MGLVIDVFSGPQRNLFTLGDLSPLNYLSQTGLSNVRLNYIERLEVSRAEKVLLCSRAFDYNADGGLKQSSLDNIQELFKRGVILFWFDQRDSAGCVIESVLPYVQLYFKKQIYADKEIYSRPLYGGRLYTDFYNQRFGVTDSIPFRSNGVESDQLKKFRLAWNLGACSRWRSSGMARFFPSPPLKVDATKIIQLSEKKILKKHKDFFCAMTIDYARQTVAFQRKALVTKLAQHSVISPTAHIPKVLYEKGLAESRFCICAFGWGEVCYRDFESIKYGCIPIAPVADMIHTFPNIYGNGISMLNFDWDLVNIENIISKALDISNGDRVSMALANISFLNEENKKIPQIVENFVLSIVDF